MEDNGYRVPSITQQVKNIRINVGNDREYPPNDYFEYLGTLLDKQDVYNIVQYIKRKLNGVGR